MQTINDYINTLEVINTQRHDNLTVNFLRGCGNSNFGIRSFNDAMADNSLIVREVGDGGNVPELNFRNNGDFPVFIGEGSIVEGLKQNRAIRVSFVIRQREEFNVPVFCVEEGRWNAHSATGRKSAYHLDSRSRILNLRHNSQGDMWDNVSERMRSSGTQSKTGYVGDIYEQNRKSIEPYQNSFVCQNNADAFIALIESRVVAMDVFATNHLLEGNFKPMLSGLSLDATDKEYCKTLSKQKALTVQQFLQSIGDAKTEIQNGIGHGRNIRFENHALVGSALVYGENLIHMEAFAV